MVCPRAETKVKRSPGEWFFSEEAKSKERKGK
jgi:hypothetical protein